MISVNDFDVVVQGSEEDLVIDFLCVVKRMKHILTEKYGEIEANVKMKVYFDTGMRD